MNLICVFSQSSCFTQTLFIHWNFFLTGLLCITNLFLIICLLIFQFSLLCWPWSFHPFLLPLDYLHAWASYPRLTQLLSHPLHCFISFCLILYLFAQRTLLRSLSAPYPPYPLFFPSPADIKPCQSSVGPTIRLPSRLHHVHHETLEAKIKSIRTAVGSLLRGQGVFLDAISYFLTLPALLHPVGLCFSPFGVFLLGFCLSQTDTVTVLTVRGVCSD